MPQCPAVPIRPTRFRALLAFVLALLAIAPAGAQAAGDWPSYGGDASNTRSQADAGTIGKASVGRLTEAWSLRQTGAAPDVTAPPFVTATPAVHAGVAFWGDYRGDVHAVNVATGAAKWTAAVGRESTVYLRQINSSPAVGGGMVVVSTGSGRLVALNEQTGAQLWSTTVDARQWSVLFGSPVIANGLVIVGTSSIQNAAQTGPYDFQGAVVALNASTGAEVWRTPTQRPGVDGPGGSVWSTPAVDAARGLVYVGTGNAYENPAGPYTDALLALNINNGAVAWSRQFTKGDVFSYFYHPLGRDYDIGGSPNLFRAWGRDVIGVGDKAGRYAVLDRATGDTIWRKQLCRGSHLGGVMTTAAVSGSSIWVTCNELRNTLELADAGNTTKIMRLGTRTGFTWWSKSVPGGTAGAVSQAGGVVFVPNTLGTIRALDADSGAELWSARPAGASTRKDYGTAGGISIAADRVLVGYGYAFDSNSAPADAVGGVVAYKVP